MFRLPFAAGNVFSASMLDTLLYQAFVKDYMITIIRLLLGIDQAPGSGFLSSMRITKDDLWIRTYGRLYQRLCSTTCEIPIGIYRTQSTQSIDIGTGIQISFDFMLPLSEQISYQALTYEVERQEISNLVRNRLQDLGIPSNDYDNCSEKRTELSYVIINPNCDLKLEEGDMIFIIKPSPVNSKKMFLNRANSLRSKSPLRKKRRKNNKKDDNNNNNDCTGNNLTKKPNNGDDKNGNDGLLKIGAIDGISLISNSGSHGGGVDGARGGDRKSNRTINSNSTTPSLISSSLEDDEEEEDEIAPIMIDDQGHQSDCEIRTPRIGRLFGSKNFMSIDNSKSNSRNNQRKHLTRSKKSNPNTTMNNDDNNRPKNRKLPSIMMAEMEKKGRNIISIKNSIGRVRRNKEKKQNRDTMAFINHNLDKASKQCLEQNESSGESSDGIILPAITVPKSYFEDQQRKFNESHSSVIGATNEVDSNHHHSSSSMITAPKMPHAINNENDFKNVRDDNYQSSNANSNRNKIGIESEERRRRNLNEDKMITGRNETMSSSTIQPIIAATTSSSTITLKTNYGRQQQPQEIVQICIDSPSEEEQSSYNNNNNNNNNNNHEFSTSTISIGTISDDASDKKNYIDDGDEDLEHRNKIDKEDHVCDRSEHGFDRHPNHHVDLVNRQQPQSQQTSTTKTTKQSSRTFNSGTIV
ncbi:uncharacterized protein NH340_JMT07059 [Sarcoptes scabiei]|nr:uncharacterized protein NH340_JMT07059 [Sarcoptes scabiei]